MARSSVCNRGSGLRALGPPGHPFRRQSLGGTGQSLCSPAPALGRAFLLREGPRFGWAGANTGCPGRARAVLENPPGWFPAPKAGAALPAAAGIPFPFLFKYRSCLGAEARHGWAFPFSPGRGCCEIMSRASMGLSGGHSAVPRPHPAPLRTLPAVLCLAGIQAPGTRPCGRRLGGSTGLCQCPLNQIFHFPGAICGANPP